MTTSSTAGPGTTPGDGDAQRARVPSGERGPADPTRATDPENGDRARALHRATPPPTARWQEIVDGASEMFAEHGYDGASIRSIAKHVGVSHPGLLHHFPTKESLLAATIDRLEAHAQETLDRVEEISAGPATFLCALDERWDPTSGPMQLLASLDAGITSRHHPDRFRVARLRRVHEHILATCLAAIADHGHLREDVEPEFASRALLGQILTQAVRESTVRSMQQSDHGDSPRCDLRRFGRLFLRASAAS